MPILPPGCLVVRAHFGNDDAWNRLKAAVERPDAATGYVAIVNFVDDRLFEGLTPDELKAQMPDSRDGPMVSFIADERALASNECPLLAVWVLPPDDELDESDYTPFRAVAAELGSVEANINLANLDWDDFTRSVDDDGVFRGFE
ncbi:MAG: hypothetical protein QOC66_1497 [Pseudonocardiales bacterium]|jgi:hypothetical protein|nr:hypothetical protein [Pseudonocardiales bacterium]